MVGFTSIGGSSYTIAMQNIGRLLVILGAVIAVVGAGVMAVGRLGLPLGRLPGDIAVHRGTFSFHFPLTTSILLSAALSLVLMLVARLLSRP